MPICKEKRIHEVIEDESEMTHIFINGRALQETQDKYLKNIIHKLKGGAKQKQDSPIALNERIAKLLL